MPRVNTAGTYSSPSIGSSLCALSANRSGATFSEGGFFICKIEVVLYLKFLEANRTDSFVDS